MKQSISIVVNETAANHERGGAHLLLVTCGECSVLLCGAAMKAPAMRADPGVGTASVRLVAADSEC